jgi:hypothetical protein
MQIRRKMMFCATREQLAVDQTVIVIRSPMLSPFPLSAVACSVEQLASITSELNDFDLIVLVEEYLVF